MKNGDMPAMPTYIGNDVIGGFSAQQAGLTKREYMAGLAMQGLLSSTGFADAFNITPESIAKESIKYADTLLARLESE